MRHRFLCHADTHGSIPAPLNESNAIAWLHAGDVCDGKMLGDPSADVQAIRQWYQHRDIPIYVVSGNHDVADPYHVFERFGDLSGGVRQITDRLFVAGIGWHGEKFFELPYERDLESVCQSVVRQAMRLTLGKDRIILLTHYPPRFIEAHDVANDKDGAGVWFNCVKDVVELLEPIAVIQGHVHQWAGTFYRRQLAMRDTLIVHPPRLGCVLEIDLDKDTAHIVEP